MPSKTRDDELDEYFAARGAALRRTAFLIVHDWHLAEDMVQTTFVKLYVALPRIRSGGLDPYARRTLVNACLSYLHKHRREQLTSRDPDVPISDVEHLDLTAALTRIPPQQRAIIALRYLDDLSVAETAAVLRVAEGTVKSQTSRALVSLRKLLPDFHDEGNARR